MSGTLPASTPVIELNKTQTYQTVDGFGFSLTGGSAYHLYRMSAAKRTALLTELFDTKGSAIGISYLRISIGASDLDEVVFSYNDLALGETDPEMTQFSLAPDRRWLIPVLKEILKINPNLKIMGSPWSPPVWMKTNQSSVGGSLRTDCYDAYALYLVKYVEEMAKEGIVIDAFTVQNEPLHPGNNPSLYMSAEEQTNFIKRSLGPAFRAAGLNTKIVIYDHNADRTDYPIAVMNDPEAKQYIDGSAFHLYGGSIDNLSQVHQAHPDRNLYFTEQWIGAPGNFSGDLGWHINNVIIGSMRNWCKVALEWNLAANSKLEPHTQGGCNQCLGALTIDGEAVVRNPAYYIVAHASKFIRPGSVRIGSTQVNDLNQVAFLTPSGEVVVLVVNNGSNSRAFGVRLGDQVFSTLLSAGAVGTFVWTLD